MKNYTDSEINSVWRAAMYGAYEGKRTILLEGVSVPLPELVPDPTSGEPNIPRMRSVLERHGVCSPTQSESGADTTAVIAYTTDDRDLPDSDLTELFIITGNTGDYYIGSRKKGTRGIGESVRIRTSGGPSGPEGTRLILAVAELYRALEALPDWQR